MALRRVQVTDFRCLQSVELQLDPQFTLISGANASGKTSVLEAIYVLGRGRSFRTRRLEHLIRHGQDQFIVFGEVEAGASRVPLGVEGSRTGIRARIGGVAAGSLAELALALPVQIIDPEVHKLIEDGPYRRRRFIDWGVFHVEPGFINIWQRYQQILRQRNAALKSRQPHQAIIAWDKELIRCAEELSAARMRYIERLHGPAAILGRSLLGQELALRYRCGWAREMTLTEALSQSWPIDRERGSTQVGPHRAELVVQLNGLAAKDHVSRGQQKLLAAALLIAQIKLFPADAQIHPTLLLDDPAAELDQQHLEALVGEVSGQANQLIVTTLQADFPAIGLPGRRFRIQAGIVQSL
ncbi:MAG: DNA replication/repair protein RecF [Steroidobacterales bacterium]